MSAWKISIAVEFHIPGGEGSVGCGTNTLISDVNSPGSIGRFPHGTQDSKAKCSVEQTIPVRLNRTRTNVDTDSIASPGQKAALRARRRC